MNPDETSARYTQRLDYIDALRGYAVMAVVATHAQILTPDLPLIVKRLADFGGQGVSLFFVVSALTLTHSWKTKDDRVVPFYIRRVFRILPAFWLAIALYLVFPWINRDYWAPHGVGLGTAALTAFALHGWHPETINAVVPGGWSIAVECGFYAIFPLLMMVVRSRVSAGLALIGVSAAIYLTSSAVLRGLISIYQGEPEYLVKIFQGIWLPNSLVIFLTGVLCWFVTVSWRAGKLVATLECLVSVAALFVLSLAPSQPLAQLSVAVSFGLLAHGLACGGGGWIVNGAARSIGVVSFSIYLWHFAVVMLLSRMGLRGWHWHGLDYVLIYALVLLLTYLLSIVTFRFIEHPMIRAGNAITRRWNQRMAVLATT